MQHRRFVSIARDESSAGFAVGIDVGGTFTDLAAVAADGRIVTTKVLTTPLDRAGGVVAALMAAALPVDRIAHIAHGTTVVTNLLLERAGARVVLCATSGFTDLLELRRQERAALYDLSRQHAPPLVQPQDIVAVDERMTCDGALRALTDEHIAEVVDAVRARGAHTVAVAFLHGYADPTHERRLADALTRALPGVDVICSHATLPEIREYERTATTVAEAYARPAVREYLERLTSRLAEHRFPTPRVLTSAGGTLSAAEAASHAAALALSGPAGGVLGAAAILRALGIADALTIDIGGTSADVGLVMNGEPLTERGGTVAGVPIALPRVLVEAVAAGGGSIAWIDEGLALRVGPESAGASPGPAAYGMGGTRATITDAHVALGHVPGGQWSGGVTISHALAVAAIAPVAEALGASVERAAQAMIATADATMGRALRRVSVDRGVDPRDVVLVAFGGGGPLHACGLADQLGMSRIVVPPHAGVLSAVGLALAPERREGLASFIVQVGDVDADSLRALIDREADRLRGRPGETSFAPDLTASWWLRTRYQGQGHEIDIPVQAGDSGAVLCERFIDAHRERTGFTLERPIESISLRTALVGVPWAVQFRRFTRADDEVSTPADVDDGGSLERTLHGPATVRLADATLYLAAGWTGRALAIGGWMLERAS